MTTGRDLAGLWHRVRSRDVEDEARMVCGVFARCEVWCNETDPRELWPTARMCPTCFPMAA